MTYTLPKKPEIPSSPEDALYFHPESEAIDLDSLQAIPSRTSVLLDVLTGYLNTPKDRREFLFTDDQLSTYLWQVSGNVDLIKKMADHASRKREAANDEATANHERGAAKR
jgi:hypothetical protein